MNRNLKSESLFFCEFFRQGVIALSRQWKNMLYNPMLFEHQYKNKLSRPMNVTFAVSQAEEVNMQCYFRAQISKTIFFPMRFPYQNDRTMHQFFFFFECVFVIQFAIILSTTLFSALKLTHNYIGFQRPITKFNCIVLLHFSISY